MTFWFDSMMDGNVGEAVQGLETLQAQVPRDNGVVDHATTAGQAVIVAEQEEATVVVMPGIFAADTVWAVVPHKTRRLVTTGRSEPRRINKRKGSRTIWSAFAMRSLMAPFLA